MRSRLLPLAAVAAFLAAAPAAAQQPAAPAGPPVIDVADPLVVPPGARLESGSWRYRVLLSRGGDTIELARRTLTAGPSPSDAATFLLVDRTDSHGQVVADSLVLSADGLRPLRRSAAMGPLRVELQFAADSVRGTMTAPGGDPVPVSLPVVPGLVASSGMLESLLTVVPLAEGWAATAVQVAPGPNGTSLVPATFRVVGADSVTVPAGTFAAWKVSVSAGGAEQFLWLDRATGRLVRSEMKPPQAADVVYLSELTEQSRER